MVFTSGSLPHVLFLEGSRLPSGRLEVPAGVLAAWCKTTTELVDRAERVRPRCIFIDASSAGDLEALVRALRRVTSNDVIVALVGRAGEVPAEIDVTLDSGPDVHGEVARLVRFALGQNVRAGVRVRSAGRALLERPSAEPMELEVIDLSEDGIRLQAGDVEGDAPVRLKLVLVNGMEVVVEARPVRRMPDSVAYRFTEVMPRTRSMLRTFLLRYGAKDPSPIPLPTRTPSTDLRGILDFCEREIVRRMLDRHSGNRTRTAKALGISRQALQQKLARFRAQDPRPA